MSLEADRRGAFWGAAFRKFSARGTDYLRVPARRFFAFLEPPPPDSLAYFPGRTGLQPSRFSPSTRRVPCPPGEGEPGWNGREDFSPLMEIIPKTPSLVLTKSGNCRRNLAVLSSVKQDPRRDEPWRGRDSSRVLIAWLLGSSLWITLASCFGFLNRPTVSSPVGG
jgi:hypothetical protein